MKKIFIRTLWCCDPWMWGNNEGHQQMIKDKLNKLGFYVLTKDRFTLEVYAVRDYTFFERWVL